MKVTIYWVRGWVDLEIDPSQIRELTIEDATEIEEVGCPFVGRNGGWLICSFLDGDQRIGSATQAVKIIRFLH